MKKLFKLLPALLIAVAGISLSSCSDDEKIVSVDQIPAAAQAFISAYYPDVPVLTSAKDKNEYEVLLKNGHKVYFNKNGEWIEVDAPDGQTVPTGFYPAEIDSYIESTTPGIGINEIDKVRRGYDVELVNGADLMFGTDGAFLGYDQY